MLAGIKINNSVRNVLENNEFWCSDNNSEKSSNNECDLMLELTKLKYEVKCSKVKIEYLKVVNQELIKGSGR